MKKAPFLMQAAKYNKKTAVLYQITLRRVREIIASFVCIRLWHVPKAAVYPIQRLDDTVHSTELTIVARRSSRFGNF